MKYTLLLLLPFFIFLSCKANPFDCKALLTDEELNREFGKPESDTLVLSDKVRLYEYQNGLLTIYGSIKPSDSILLIEKVWAAHPFKLVRWYESADNPIDCLTWDTDEQKF